MPRAPRTAWSWLAILLANGAAGLAGAAEPEGAATPPRSDLEVRQARCDEGDGGACGELGLDVLKGKGVPKDPRRALQLLERACTAGSATGCSNAGSLHAAGIGTRKDPEAARDRFALACQLEARTCFNLAGIHDRGEGVPRDPVQAAALYRKACEAGNPQSCNNLGTRTLKGAGVERDPAQAASLFLQACRGGDQVGCGNLSHATEAEPQAVVHVLRKAADGGDGVAAVILGFVYEQGRAAPRDLTAARALYAQSCRSGVQDGCDELARLDQEAAKR